jgi:non-heme chloroperoxidase
MGRPTDAQRLRANDPARASKNRRKDSPVTRTVHLSTGVTVPYLEQGDPDGLPVVLLHGYSDSLRSYELLLPQLPDTIHAFAYTQRGHAGASKPRSGYHLSDYVADAAAFMDAMGIEVAVVVGHSGGSYTAQRFALDHPDRTLGVVLIGAFRAFHDNPGILELREATSQFTDPVDPEFVREFQESCVAQPVPAAFLDAIVAGSLELPARVWQDYLEGLLAASVPTESGTIAAPTLILWGDQDDFCPRSDQDALVAAIPRATLEVYAGTGHCPHWEQAERAAAELTAFATTVGQPDVASLN